MNGGREQSTTSLPHRHTLHASRHALAVDDANVVDVFTTWALVASVADVGVITVVVVAVTDVDDGTCVVMEGSVGVPRTHARHASSATQQRMCEGGTTTEK